jgi:signal transduction histidine kinase/ligand-binding sensor domain-containing protein
MPEYYHQTVSTSLPSRYRIFSSALAGLLWLVAFTVAAGEPDSSWYERSWQSAEGLPDNSVVGVAQTPDGYLWVSTAGGLMKFDGVRFQEFPLVTLDGVRDRVVRAMYLDASGRLWLGMDRGPIVCIAPDSTKVFANVPDRNITCIAGDSDGTIWIGYATGSLTQIKNGQVTVFTSAKGWPAGSGGLLASDSAGHIWFAKGNQVGILQEGTFQTLLTLPKAVDCIGRRPEGGIWICSGRRLLKYEPGGDAQLFGELPSGPGGITGTALFEDRTGALWVGTTASGLFRCTGTGIARVSTSDSEISCLTQDTEDNLWVGTAGGGLDRLRPRIIQLLGTDSGLPNENVRSVCEDVSGAIWVVTRNGLLASWQSNAWKVLPEGNDEPAGFFSCVAADPNGGLWVGTRDRGFYHLQQNGQWQNWSRSNGLSANDVRSIFQSSSGDVYIATDGPSRLQRLRQGQLQWLEAPFQLRSIRALAEDMSGRIWVASADGRLLQVQDDRLLDETPGVTNRLYSIRCLHTTPDGSLWIGYAGWGIGWLKDGHYARITSAQGLYDDYVSQMLADEHGWLWCAGNRGIFEVKLDQLRTAFLGGDRLHCIAYSQGEGFPNLQANYENVPGAMRSRDGRLWFPMFTGLAIVRPQKLPADMRPPLIALERVAVDGQIVGIYDRFLSLDAEGLTNVVNLRSNSGPDLRLPPSMHQLDFQFTALSFTTPENMEFEYRLRGLDDNWSEPTTERSVSYPRLPRGDYSFQVRACNLAGVWDQQPASLNFVVLPFYWETWWFRLSVLVAFTAVIVAIVRYVSFQRLRNRLRLLEQQAALQKERARIAKDIHDDLGADLTQIAYLGELAQQDSTEPGKVSERIGTISSTARQAVKSLDEIVWAVNPRNDTLPHLIDYAGQFAVDYLRPTGIRCRLDFPEQIPAWELSTNLRHNLFLVIKEALHNIVKHAGATEIWLRVDLREDMRKVVVEDNGRGFIQAPDDALADGLRNMRQRIEEIGGECRVESQPQTGTRVILHLPWQKV